MTVTCYDIKMAEFIKCLLGESIIDGFEEIYSEYVGLRESKSASYLLTLINDIDYLKSKQFIIFKLIEVLADIPDKRLIAELKSKGCRGKFDFNDKAQYSNDLRAAYSYGKKFNGQIRARELEIENFSKKNGGKDVNRKFFEDLAATLESYCNHSIDFETITVARFVSKWNQYDKYCEVAHADKNNMINKPYGR